MYSTTAGIDQPNLVRWEGDDFQALGGEAGVQGYQLLQ